MSLAVPRRPRQVPPDEFDVDGFASHRTGAHRARPGALVRWGPTALAAAGVLAVLVVLGGALLLLGPGGVAALVVRLWQVAGSAVGLSGASLGVALGG